MGALAHERDGYREGAHAVARDAAGGVGGVEDGHRAMTFASRPMLLVAAYVVFVRLLRRETPLG